MLIVIAAVAITFGPLISHDFIEWDDNATVYDNPRLNPVTWENVGHYWAHSEGALYIPVTYTAWSGLAVVGRLQTVDERGVSLNPAVFRAFNMLVHVGSALLVLGIIVRLTKDTTAAVIGALVFALHPLQVETVGWISGLKDLLWGFFALAAIDQYLRFRLNTAAPWRFYVAGTVFLILAMLSKPAAMVTPAIVIAVDALLLRRPWRQIAASAGPWLVLTVPCMVIARVVQAGATIDLGPLWKRPLLVLDSVAFYIGKLLWPFNLAPDYGHRPAVVLHSTALYWTWIVPVAFAVVAIWQFRRRPWLAAGMAVFVIAALPTLGFVPYAFQYFSTTADHYVYLSLFGVALMAGFAIAERRPPRRAVIAVSGVLLFLLSVRSITQAHVWADTPTLYAHILRVNPDSFMTMTAQSIHQWNAGNPAETERLLRRSVEIAPDYAYPNKLLASFLGNTGRVDESMVYVERFVRLRLAFPKEERGDLRSHLRKLAIYHHDRRNLPAARYWLELTLQDNPADTECATRYATLKATP